jgi:hypothetical protein
VQLSHRPQAIRARFDDPNLVSSGGLVPVMALAESSGLRELADERLSVPTDKGANAGLKVASLVAGMVAGADSIDDMALLRHGGMGRVFDHAYAPSTLGSFLRAFTFGHVRQLDAVASRFVAALAGRSPLVGRPRPRVQRSTQQARAAIVEIVTLDRDGSSPSDSARIGPGPAGFHCDDRVHHQLLIAGLWRHDRNRAYRLCRQRHLTTGVGGDAAGLVAA